MKANKIRRCEGCHTNPAEYIMELAARNGNPQEDELWDYCHDCLIVYLKHPLKNIVSVNNLAYENTN